MGGRTRIAVRALAAALALAAVGCRGAGGPVLGGISVRVEAATARTFVPEGDWTPADYVLDGVGPAEATFRVVVTESTTVVPDLACGEWTVRATARNSAEQTVAEGETGVVVEPDRVASAQILLGVPAGDGALEITVLWSMEGMSEPTPTAELLDAQGALLALDPPVTVAPGEALVTGQELAAGWYTLLVRLYDGPTLVAGGADALLVRAGSLTRGSVDLRAAVLGGAGGAGITLVLDTPVAIPMILAGQHAAVLPAQSLTLETWPGDDAQRWYLDGSPAGAGPALTLDAPVLLGAHRLDTLAIAGSLVHGAHHAFEVREPVAPGSLTRAFDLVDGDGAVSGLRGARAAVVSPDGTRLYATGYDADSLVVFQRSPATGLLRWLARAVDGGVGALDGPDGLAISPGGRHLYVAGYTSDALSVWCCDLAGSPLPVQTVPGLDGARAVAVSPDGQHVYAALALADAIAVFRRDPESGLVTPAGTLANGQAGLATLLTPTDMVLSPGGEHLYVAAYGGDAVHWFGRDALTGALAWLGEARDGVGGVTGLNGAHGVAISPDGLWVFAVSYYGDSLVSFRRDPVGGGLTPARVHTDGIGGVDGLSYARDVAASSGAVGGAGGGDDAIAVVRLDGEGTVFGETVALPDGPRGLAPSADGRSLYATCSTAGSLTLLCVSP